jgi:hypothetical protein
LEEKSLLPNGLLAQTFLQLGRAFYQTATLKVRQLRLRANNFRERLLLLRGANEEH